MSEEQRAWRSWTFAQAMHLEDKNDALSAIVMLIALVVEITKENDIGKLFDQHLPPLSDDETLRRMTVEIVPQNGPPSVPVSIRMLADEVRDRTEPAGVERTRIQ